MLLVATFTAAEGQLWPFFLPPTSTDVQTAGTHTGSLWFSTTFNTVSIKYPSCECRDVGGIVFYYIFGHVREGQSSHLKKKEQTFIY